MAQYTHCLYMLEAILRVFILFLVHASQANAQYCRWLPKVAGKTADEGVSELAQRRIFASSRA